MDIILLVRFSFRVLLSLKLAFSNTQKELPKEMYRDEFNNGLQGLLFAEPLVM